MGTPLDYGFKPYTHYGGYLKDKYQGQRVFKIIADGAKRLGMIEMNVKPFIQGFTTNQSLMKKAGIRNYKAFG